MSDITKRKFSTVSREAGKGDKRRPDTEYSNPKKFDKWETSFDARKKSKDIEKVCKTSS